ncbi:MAG TPA: PAS domain-containing protein, partial [Tianweitania sediminis]|nr:PAS domain-containing protein [Tianweitania sediminis]
MNQVYSFIDVVALEPVRTRFAAGEALVVFDADLDEILWANGAGAKALGFQAIDEAMGAANPLPAIARRQIAATPGYPHVQPNRTIVVRSAATLLSRLSRLALEPVTLPDGEVAVLVSFLDLAAEPDKAWQQAIAGFAVDDHAAAILDEGGKALAATSSFEEARFHDADLAALAASAAHARGQVAKRRLPSRRGLLPAGLAKLGDDPALFLLIAVSEGAEPGDTPASAPSEMPASDAADDAATMEEAAIPAAAHVAEGSAGRKGSLRFVWRTDAQGCFSAISPEFLEAMGSDEGAVIGRSFRELAAALGFDEDGEITGLLERRDTWSGRSVLWPLPGNGSMRAPVDLAALPVYDRNRVFEGFRGFGVARFIDAVAADPVAELAKSTADPQAVPTIDDEAPGEVEEDPFRGEPPVLVSTEAANERPSSPSSTIEKVVRLAAHRQALAERAALSSSERIAFQEIGHRLKAADEAAPESEKVMSIVTDVPQQPSAEASALPVIPVAPSADPAPAIAPQDSDVNFAGSEPRRDAQPADEPAAEENEDVTARAAVEGSWPRATKIPLADRVLELPPSARMEEPTQSVAHDGSVDEDDEHKVPALEEDAVSPSLDGGATPAEVAAIEEEHGESGDEVSPTELVETTDASPAPFVGIEPLAADAPVALPPTVDHDVQAADSLLEDFADLQSEPAFGDDEEVSGRFGEQPSFTKLPDAERELIDALPIALIIHAGDRLDFANREFFSLTGFDSLAAISAAGGLEALFPAPVGKETAAKDRRLFVRRFDGEQIPVHAHLQSVPWGGGKSLMLSLRRAEGEPQSEWSALQDLHDTDIPQNPENLGDNVTRLPLTLVTPPQQAVPQVTSVDEDALSRTQALLDEMRAIIDTATDGVVLITPDSRIRSLSQP